ncbi:hypothetical protein QQZ08_009643 [Neonectria magnoliae]|uniref:Uncharacterized protein n=1 Tax=Neonectria magnoliae TaxID=2732573 RepID=A0ABR1HLT4_9HYPO
MPDEQQESTESGPLQRVGLYSLAKFNAEQESSILEALSGDLAEPFIIPWTDDKDGNLDDIYRLYKSVEHSPEGGSWTFVFFLDREALLDNSVIIAKLDMYTLVFSQETAQEVDHLIKEHSSSLPGLDDALAESLIDDLSDRALTYGRVKAEDFQTTWANLDIANMDVGELVEFSGYTLRRIPNPEWDAKGFLRKAESVYQKRELEEGKA